MTTLCVFNPEHDLCLANGNEHYVPPQSALRFADEGRAVMRSIYGDDVLTTSVDGVGKVISTLPTDEEYIVIPWGWDSSLKYRLLKQGVKAHCLMSDEKIEIIRALQHRSSTLPLQPDVIAATSVMEVERFVVEQRRVVLKAPWSGAGRGLRWISDRLSEHDVHWIERVVADQRCVMVEPRRNVVADFALEYYVGNPPHTLRTGYEDRGSGFSFLGYSLFETQSGVYRRNICWSGMAIREYIVSVSSERTFSDKVSDIERWMRETLVGRYDGPLGVDLFVDDRCDIYVSEVNLRHTMGMVCVVD